VEIVCERYNIPYVTSFNHLVPALRVMMEKKGLKLDSKGDFIGEKKKKKEESEVQPKVDRWWLQFQDTEEEKWAKLTKREQARKLEERAAAAEKKKLEEAEQAGEAEEAEEAEEVEEAKKTGA
jgi:hypothetical protein